MIGDGLLHRIELSDRLIALAGMAVALFSIIFLLATGLGTTFLFPAALILIVCAAWFIVRRMDYWQPRIVANSGQRSDVQDGHEVAGNNARSYLLALSSLFFLLATASILLLHYRGEAYERPLPFFVIAALMCGVIAAEVPFTTSRQVPFVLGQMIVVSLIISWSSSILFPDVLGIDPWVHQSFTQDIVISGRIPDGFAYSRLPLFHVFSGQAMILMDLDFKPVQMIVLTTSQLLVQVSLVYLISKRLFGHHRIALFSALATTLATWPIILNIMPVPTSLGFTFVLVTAYLLLRPRDLRTTSLICLLFISVVFAHTIAAVAMAIILITGFVASRVSWPSRSPGERFSNLIQIVLFISLTLGWWYFATDNIETLTELIQWGFSSEMFFGKAGSEFVVPLVESLFNVTGLFVFCTVSFIGVLHSMSIKGSRAAATVACVGVVLLGVGYVAMVGNLGFLQERWWYFSGIFLAVPMGATFWIMLNISSRSRSPGLMRKALPYLGVSLVVFSLAFVAIMNPNANQDNPTFSPVSSIRSSFTESELIGASFANTSGNAVICTDLIFGGSPPYGVFPNKYHLDGQRLCSLDPALTNNAWGSDGTMKVIRDSLFDRPFRMEGWNYKLDYDLAYSLVSSDLSKIYTNPTVSAFT